MAFNLVSEIIRLITPAAIERIAATLGINGDLARKGIAAAIPALLAVLGSKALATAGTKRVHDAVAQADPNIFDKLTTALSGAKGDKFIESGTGILSSLLGENALSSVTGAVARQTGLSGVAGSSLMAIASQLALGGLAKNVRDSGLDASGLANLLSSQQENIRAALPSGLGSLLSSAGVLGEGFTAQTGRAASEAGRAASAAASQAKAAAQGGTNWLMWLIPLALIVAGLWYFLGQGDGVPTTTDTTTAPVVTDLMVDGVDVGKQLTAAFDGLKTTLGGITDVASAQAALPKLQETVTAIDGVSGMLSKLTAEQKTALAALVAAALPAIKETANKVLAIQGVGDVAKPVVDSLMAKLEALAKPV